ncbi:MULTISPECIES: DUF2127 domain-containing protein [unclassified Pseudonocardia]|jgi:uncharacterized membrane protein|uniref:DUF2127 domain-containing protein n=1 Tax=unclassified Pseudonocardia TaxID=2619320 RepID=UPI00095E4737|nr:MULTISPECIES: DUF2127 domain-containing protein [unclassified Pseudonocardia]MBN9101298.1 DUF2127 domain-containing protein [Pseudonocardia sp.]OJY42610.1 MAG: hypothetical protein BGP03_23735 [Pseudonocardia sp. 73-21]
MKQETLFRIALLLKGIDGAIELVGAIVLLIIPTGAVQTLINDVLSRDLLGPPDGSLAKHFVSGTAEFASGNRTFAVIYLGLHGIVKLALVVAMLRKIRPAFPVAVVVLGAFVVYEIYRATQTGSVLLPFLAALDVAIIVLIIREYRSLRTEHVDGAGDHQPDGHQRDQ